MTGISDDKFREMVQESLAEYPVTTARLREDERIEEAVAVVRAAGYLVLPREPDEGTLNRMRRVMTKAREAYARNRGPK